MSSALQQVHLVAGHVKLNRMDKRSQLNCLKECGRLLGLGCSVLFFPEGTRTKDGKMAAFKKVCMVSSCLFSQHTPAYFWCNFERTAENVVRHRAQTQAHTNCSDC